MLETDKNLAIAIKASLAAGKEIMNIYDSVVEVEYKDDKSPLTQADKNANNIINTFLVPTNIPIISEENKQIEYSVRKQWNTCWIVDPVDGTKEFIKRNGEFTVNIALVKKGIPVLGVIYAPATKTIYFADVKNNKAFKAYLKTHNSSLEDIEKEIKPLNPKVSNSETVQVVGSRSHMNQDTLNFIDKLKKQGNDVEIVSKGSSLKFCLVAEGNADIYPRYAPTMEWDTAAGQAICNAVGIHVISKETNKALSYNKENLLNPWFLVSNNERQLS
ncbi:MAG: 3'(2'),5'-bisphosphate nucleotidase CysQ [Flavobacteriaceae bacterium]